MPTQSSRDRISSVVDQDYKESLFEKILTDGNYVNKRYGNIWYDTQINIQRSLGMIKTYSPAQLKQALQYAGLHTKKGLVEFQDYLTKQRNTDNGFWNLDDYAYEDISRGLNNEFRSIPNKDTGKTTEEEVEEEAEQYIESLREAKNKQFGEGEHEGKGVYDEEIKRLEGLDKEADQFAGKLDTSKAEAIKNYGVADDLIDEMTEQAQEYSSSPSIVDSTIEDNLADNLRNDIRAKMAARTRYGGLETNPEAKQAQERIALAKSRITGKLAESQQKQGNLQNALGRAGDLKTRIADSKSTITQNNLSGLGGVLNSKANISNSIGKINLGRIPDSINFEKGIDEEGLRKQEYLDFRAQQEEEPFNRFNRLQDAYNKKGTAKFDVGVGVAGLGAAFLGGPVTAGIGLSAAKEGFGNALNNSGRGDVAINEANSLRKTKGFYGKGTRYFDEGTVYGSTPSTSGSTYAETGGKIADLASDWFTDRAKKRKNKSSTDKKAEKEIKGE